MEKSTPAVRTLEVVGDLSNPYVVTAFLVWALLAAGVTLVFLCLVFGPAGRGRTRNVLIVLSAALMCLSLVVTPLAHQLIVTALYASRDSTIVSVGIWGGPSSFLSWLAGSLVAGCAFVLYRRISSAWRGGNG